MRRPPRFASAAYDCGTHVGSPPASPAAGPHSAPLVGGVPRRLWSAGCLAQTAADAARLEQARAALKFLVERLRPVDRFNIVTYAATADVYANEMRRPTPELVT